MDPDRIEISLYASLRKWRPEPNFVHEISRARTVREVLLEIGIPERDAAIIILNGKRGRPETAVSNGDKLCLFPLIGGG